MIEIDPKNDRILQELSRDGRISNIELAERVGLSPSACLRRVQELERSGVITGYRATINPSAVGRGFTAYVAVGLSNHTKKAQKAFEAAIEQAHEVLECHNVTARWNICFGLRWLTWGLTSISHGCAWYLPQVSSISTFVVLESPKDTRG